MFYLPDPIQLGYILVSLALKLILDGAGRRGQLKGELHPPRIRFHCQILDKAAGNDVLAKIGVNDARQLAQDLFLACLWRHLHADSCIMSILLAFGARE